MMIEFCFVAWWMRLAVIKGWKCNPKGAVCWRGERNQRRATASSAKTRRLQPTSVQSASNYPFMVPPEVGGTWRWDTVFSSDRPLTPLSGTITFPFHLLRRLRVPFHWALSFSLTLSKLCLNGASEALNRWPLCQSGTKAELPWYTQCMKSTAEHSSCRGSEQLDLK